MPTLDYIQPSRYFSLAYPIIDSLILILFVVLLFVKKKRVTAIWSLFGGVLYFLVDFLIFYLATGSRQITATIPSQEDPILLGPGYTALVLFWMSMSYGIFDFAFIWLWLSDDKDKWAFSAIILLDWICVPWISEIFSSHLDLIWIYTTRSTWKYHGVMALIMLIGYLILVCHNLFSKKEKAPLGKLFLIGFLAQFFWEASLFIFTIRSTDYANDDIRRRLTTMLGNSLIETNLGMPYIYLIHQAVTRRIKDDGTKARTSEQQD